MKIQGSLEYLIVFSAILAVALILIFLLGSETPYSNQNLVDQSNSYWKSKRPIAIIGFVNLPSLYNNIFRVTFKNNDLRTVKLISLLYIAEGTTYPIFPPIFKKLSSEQVFSTNLWFPESSASCKNKGDLVEAKIEIYLAYPDVSDDNFVEIGEVPLRTICSNGD